MGGIVKSVGKIFGGGSSQQQSSSSGIDPRFFDIYKGNIDSTNAALNSIGPRGIAGFNGMQNQAFGQLANANNNAGMQAMRQGLNFRPSMGMAATAQTMPTSNFLIGNYMNPFENQVVNNTIRDLSRANTLNNQNTRAQAASLGAYGGSRQAIAEAENNRNFMDQVSDTVGALRSQGFNTALGASQQDVARMLQAGQFNAGQTNAMTQQNIANQLQAQQMRNSLADNYNQSFLGNTAALMSGGDQQQALRQQQMDAYRNNVIEELNLRNAAIGLSPGGGSGMVNSSSGGGSSQGGIGSSLGGIAQMGALMMMMSDPRSKENIKKGGSLDALKQLNGYSYNYKDRPGFLTGGVMSDEVAKVMPSAVVPMGGMNGVDYSQVTGLLVNAVKELDRKVGKRNA